jgi:AAA domain-containing protein/bifunctional DNA primase/polymerase-like protein
LFSHDTFTALFGAARPGELDALAGIVRAAVREGYAIVLNEPGTKKPVCPLTASARKRADREAQDEALSAGRPAAGARHACGVNHALTAADALKVTGLVRRLTVTDEDGTVHLPNIGVEPGASRMLVVDVDTAAENDAFLATWRAEAGPEVSPPLGYTVASPGVRKTILDEAGAEQEVWVHRDGGHYWFTLPEGLELPTAVGLLKDESGWGAAWRGRQVLVPPSVRPEGPYRLLASPTPAPPWLLDRVFMAAEARAERERIRAERWAARAEGGGDLDPVDAWSAATPWTALLGEDGWVETGLVDTCSCPTWTAPGGHASPKSATAHDEGCTRYDSEDGHAPLHIWTDNPPDYLADAARTLNKLTYVAYRDHHEPGGTKSEAESGAVKALGLAAHPALDGAAEELEDFRAMLEEPGEPIHPESTPDPPEGASALADPFDTPGSVEPATTAPRPDDPAGEDPEPGPWFDWTDLSLIPPPEPMIEGVLDHRTMVMMAGKFGTYKTFLALDWAACLATGTPWAGHAVPEALPVVYVAAEGVGSFDRRLGAWGAGHEVRQRKRGMLTIHHGPVQLMKNDAMSGLVATIKEREARLVVVDTFSRCATGVEENDATAIAAALERLFLLRDVLGVTVLVLHHTGHQGLRSRGSSVLDDNADASWVIKLNGENNEDRGPDNPRTLEHRKSKDGELLPAAPMALVPVPEARSAYLSFDPMNSPSRRLDAERAGRIAELVSELTAKGVDKGQSMAKMAAMIGRSSKEREVQEALREYLARG